jgi:hypothetical protein
MSATDEFPDSGSDARLSRHHRHPPWSAANRTACWEQFRRAARWVAGLEPGNGCHDQSTGRSRPRGRGQPSREGQGRNGIFGSPDVEVGSPRRPRPQARVVRDRKVTKNLGWPRPRGRGRPRPEGREREGILGSPTARSTKARADQSPVSRTPSRPKDLARGPDGSLAEREPPRRRRDEGIRPRGALV